MIIYSTNINNINTLRKDSAFLMFTEDSSDRLPCLRNLVPDKENLEHDIDLNTYEQRYLTKDNIAILINYMYYCGADAIAIVYDDTTKSMVTRLKTLLRERFLFTIIEVNEG